MCLNMFLSSLYSLAILHYEAKMSQGRLHMHAVWEMERILLWLSCWVCNNLAFLLCSHSYLSHCVQKGPGEPEGDEAVARYVPLCSQRAERQSAADGGWEEGKSWGKLHFSSFFLFSMLLRMYLQILCTWTVLFLSSKLEIVPILIFVI